MRRKPGLLIGGEDCGVLVVGESRNYREVRTSSLSRQGNYEQSGLVCNGAISFRITRLYSSTLDCLLFYFCRRNCSSCMTWPAHSAWQECDLSPQSGERVTSTLDWHCCLPIIASVGDTSEVPYLFQSTPNTTSSPAHFAPLVKADIAA